MSSRAPFRPTHPITLPAADRLRSLLLHVLHWQLGPSVGARESPGGQGHSRTAQS